MLKSQVSFRACGILTTEDAENLEIAKKHAGGGPETEVWLVVALVMQ